MVNILVGNSLYQIWFVLIIVNVQCSNTVNVPSYKLYDIWQVITYEP